MRANELIKRNLKEIWRDPLSLGLTIALPAVMLIILMQALEGVDPFFTATSLAPGILLFGFVMLMFSSALILSRDRESALFARLLTTPLRPTDFVAAYSLPYLAVALLQGAVVFALAGVLGLEVNGNAATVVLVLALMAVFYIGLGMILGSLLDAGPLSGAYSAVLLLTIFAGTWFDLEAMGGPVRSLENALPFVHALNATRDVLADGASLSDVASDVSWVLGYTAVVVVLAGFTFRSRMSE